MAVVGEAYIVVRAITDQVRDDIRRGFDGAGDIGNRAGQDAGKRFSDGFNRGSSRRDIFANLERSTSGAADAFTSLVRTGYTVGPILAALAGGISAVGAGLFAMASQAVAAGPALMSLVGIISSLVQAASVLKFVFGGVGAAISAGLNQGSGGGGGGGGLDLSRQIEDAKERIEDARKNIARVYQQNAEALKRANQQITDALEAEVEAYENLEEAERDVQRSEEDLAKAQEEVTEARKEAVEQIQQLRFELEESVISEERASMSLEKAAERLAKAQSLPPDNRLRREADLEFKEAELRLRRAKDRTSDLSKEVDEANKKGVEGSDVVVAAKEREKRAEEGLANAKKNVGRAERDLARASRDVTEAYDNYNATLAENKTRLEDAKEAIEDAKEALEDLKNQVGAGGAGGGVDAFAEAMAKLSPAAQDFVRKLIEISKALEPIRKAAQEEFFSRFNVGLDKLVDVWLPKLNELLPTTAGVLGEVATGIAGVLTETENVGRIESIWRNNDKVIKNVGLTVESLATSFFILLDAAGPLTLELSKWVAELTKGWKETLTTKEKTGELEKTFGYARDVAKDLGAALGGIFRGLINIGKEAAGPGSGGEKLLKSFRDAGLEFEKWTEKLSKDGTLKLYFLDAADNFEAIAGFVVTLVKELAKIGDNPGIAPFFDSLSKAAETLGLAGDSIASSLPSVGEFVEEIAEFIRIVTESNAIEVFFDTLKEGFKAINNFLKSDLGQRLLDAAGPVLAFAAALGIFAQAASFLAKAGIGKLIKPITGITGAFGAFGITVGGGKVAAAVGIIAAIAGAIYLMWTESENFREEMKKLIDIIQEEFAAAWEDMEAALASEDVQTTLQDVKDIFKMLGDLLADDILPIIQVAVPIAFDAAKIAIGLFAIQIKGLISGIKWFLERAIELETFFEELPEKLGAAIEEVENFVGAIPEALGGVVEEIENFFGSIPEKAGAVVDGLETWVQEELLPFFYNLPSTLINAGFDLFDFIVEQAANAVTGVFTFFTETFIPGLIGLPEDVANAITGLWDSLWQFGEDAGKKVREWITQDFIPDVKALPGKTTNALKDLFKKITDEASERYEAIKTWITDELIPSIEEIPGKATTALTDTFKELLTSAEEVFEDVKSFFTETVFPYLGEQVVSTFGKRLGPSWDKLIQAFKDVWGQVTSYWTDTVLPWLQNRPEKITAAVGNLWNSILQKFKNIFGTDIPAYWNETVVPWLESLPDKVSRKIGNVFGSIASNFQGVISSIVSWWNNLSFTFGPVPTNLITERLGIAGDSFTISTPNADLPWAKDGGIVFPRRGGVIVGVAEAGQPERIEPLDPNGLSKRDKAMIDYLSGGAGGGTTINVYPSPGMDERELAEKVSRELAFMMRRGSV